MAQRLHNAFIFILVSSGCLSLSGRPIPDTAGAVTHSKPAGSPAFRIGIHATTGYHAPLGGFRAHWDGYFTGGIQSEVPTYMPRLLLHFTIETGECSRKNSDTERISIFHSSLAVSYAFPITSLVSLRPRIGLMTSTIYHCDLKTLSNSTIFKEKFFGDSESEFGVTGGVEPVLGVKRFRFGIPLTYDITFSSPDPLITLKAAFTAGAVL